MVNFLSAFARLTLSKFGIHYCWAIPSRVRQSRRERNTLLTLQARYVWRLFVARYDTLAHRWMNKSNVSKRLVHGRKDERAHWALVKASHMNIGKRNAFLSGMCVSLLKQVKR